MKLQRIHIQEYRVLNNFTLDLEQTNESDYEEDLLSSSDYTLDLLVGINGTGKSSLLHAIAEIFQYLERQELPKFGFEITYQTQSYPGGIFISNLEDKEQTPDNTLQPLLQGNRIRFHDKAKTQDAEIIEIAAFEISYLPPLIVALTSGRESGWLVETNDTYGTNTPDTSIQPMLTSNEPLLPDTLRNWYLSELPGKPVEERPKDIPVLESNFLFISADLIPLAVLCGLLSTNNGKKAVYIQQALDESKLKGLRGFSLKFRMISELLRAEQREVIEELGKFAHHTIQTGSDYLLVFVLTNGESTTPATSDQNTSSAQSIMETPIITAEQLPGLRGGGLGLFKALAHLKKPEGNRPPILSDIHLFLEGNRVVQPKEQASEKSPLHLFDWLSDGEQSFLGRLCLLALLGDDEALVLLDEPEVHFNDYWKRKLVHMIVQSLQTQDAAIPASSHVIMTTHSSITLSDVLKTNVWVLKREGDYTARAFPPNLQTLGTDPSDIIVAIFGAENAVGAQSVSFIVSEIKRITSSDAEEAEKIRKLQVLQKRVGPSYWRFLIRREIVALEGAVP